MLLVCFVSERVGGRTEIGEWTGYAMLDSEQKLKRIWFEVGSCSRW